MQSLKVQLLGILILLFAIGLAFITSGLGWLIFVLLFIGLLIGISGFIQRIDD